MFIAKCLKPRLRPFKFCPRFRPGPGLRGISQRAFKLDFGAAAGAFVLQLQFVVSDHSLDQLVTGDHPLLSTLQLRSFLGSDLWTSPAGVHRAHYLGWIFRT